MEPLQPARSPRRRCLASRREPGSIGAPAPRAGRSPFERSCPVVTASTARRARPAARPRRTARSAPSPPRGGRSAGKRGEPRSSATAAATRPRGTGRASARGDPRPSAHSMTSGRPVARSRSARIDATSRAKESASVRRPAPGARAPAALTTSRAARNAGWSVHRRCLWTGDGKVIWTNCMGATQEKAAASSHSRGNAASSAGCWASNSTSLGSTAATPSRTHATWPPTSDTCFSDASPRLA